jgi:predicted HTH domain antitoxin
MSEESVNEDKAYKSATNNELALYVTILSNQKVAAKSRGKTEEVEYLEKDIEEVKKELQDRKVKDSVNKEAKGGEGEKPAKKERIDFKEVARYSGMSYPEFYSKSRKVRDEIVARYKKDHKSVAGDIDETTTAASGAAGSYVTPQMWAKNRRNWRLAAKPTWHGGKFVKFKDRCVKYNNKKWCSQGAIDKPIELVSTLMEAATKISEETGKEVDYIAQLMSKRYSIPNEHLSEEVIELAKEHGYEMFSGVGQTEFTKQPNDGQEYEITVDGVNGDIQAMIHNLEDNTFGGKTFDTFEDAIEYLENI